MATTSQKQGAQVVKAPQRPPILQPTSIFLAGTTTMNRGQPDWRETVTTALFDSPITIFNPYRPDWNWKEDIADERFREQTHWELDMQDLADLIVFYFGPETDAPVSLLELGLSARKQSGQVIVCCARGYRKRGNVQVVAQRFGFRFIESLENLSTAISDWLSRLQEL